MVQFKAIIFDLDGTLVDSEVVWEEAETEMFEERGLEFGADIREQIVGLRMDEFMARVIDEYDLQENPEKLSEELINRMLAKIPSQVEAKAGADELVRWVAQQDIPYCIASSSPQSIIEASVHSQNWQDIITLRYSANIVPNGKPAPDIYQYAAEQLGVASSDCLAIEDSLNGAKAAVAAGMICYAVPETAHSRNALEQITPHIFQNLHEILKSLQNIG